MVARAHCGVHTLVFVINKTIDTFTARQASGRAAGGRVQSVLTCRPTVGQAGRVHAVVLADLERVVQGVGVPEVDGGTGEQTSLAHAVKMTIRVKKLISAI